MTNITTPFTGTETTAQTQTKLSAIANYWAGSSTALSGAGSWGAVRAILNNFANAANQINNYELASSFIDKLNWLNDSDNMVTPLFALGEQGVWYDPSDMSTLFQDSAGTTPVTAVEQPVGLMLDKHEDLELGPELVTNGDFSNGSTGWTAGAGCTIASGQVTFTGSGANVTLTQTMSTAGVAGAVYQIEYTVVSNTLNGGAFRVGGLAGASFFGSTPTNLDATVGVKQRYFSGTPAGAGNAFDMYITSGATSGTLVIDNISIKRIAGNHASQTTSASRPVLSARYNLLRKTEEFDDVAWVKTNLNTTGTPPYINVETAPNGTLTADGIIEAAVLGNHNIGQAASVNSGTILQASVYVKNNGRGFIIFSLDGLAFSSAVHGISFNFSTKIATVIVGSLLSFSVEELADGWFRLSISQQTSASNLANMSIRLSQDGIWANRSYTGDGTSGIYIWGADLRVANDGVGLPVYQRVNVGTAGSSTASGTSDYDTSGFPVYLSFDGTDDWMSSTSIDFTSTDEMSVFAGVRYLRETTTEVPLELSASFISNTGTFAWVNESSGAQRFSFSVRGNAAIPAGLTDTSSPAAPNTMVASVIYDLAQPTRETEILPRVNGEIPTLVVAGGADAGGGNFGNYPIYIGRRGGSSLQFSGRFYSIIVRGAITSAPQLAQTETWVNSKTKAY